MEAVLRGGLINLGMLAGAVIGLEVFGRGTIHQALLNEATIVSVELENGTFHLALLAWGNDAVEYRHYEGGDTSW